MIRPISARALAIAGLTLAAALAGCGKTGELQRPAPLFGRGGVSAQEVEGKDRKDRQDPSRPVRTVDPRNEALDPSPPRAAPVAGQNPDPLAPGPQGAMGSPYADPDR